MAVELPKTGSLSFKEAIGFKSDGVFLCRTGLMGFEWKLRPVDVGFC